MNYGHVYEISFMKPEPLGLGCIAPSTPPFKVAAITIQDAINRAQQNGFDISKILSIRLAFEGVTF